MRACIGCSFSRDARGDPGEMTLRHAELTPEEARMHFEKFLRAAGVRPARMEGEAWPEERTRTHGTADGT